MTHADLLPFTIAAVEWARDGQGKLVMHDACFARDAAYKAPEEKRPMAKLFAAVSRSYYHPSDVRRFYGFLAVVLSRLDSRRPPWTFATPWLGLADDDDTSGAAHERANHKRPPTARCRC